MDNDVLAYRVLLEKRKENAPFWEKKVLTVEEAAEYTGIGRLATALREKHRLIEHDSIALPIRVTAQHGRGKITAVTVKII